MRSLMDRWKAVPRTGREGDDDLWKQFRAAQDVFFTARAESDKKRNRRGDAPTSSRRKNCSPRPRSSTRRRDLRGAQNALRKIQERYDAIGHVPRGAMRSLEDRMQAVEQKVRGAADSTRARTAPENPMVTSMRAAVTKAEEQLAKAEAAGDESADRGGDRPTWRPAGSGWPRPRSAPAAADPEAPSQQAPPASSPRSERAGGGADPRHAEQDARRRSAGCPPRAASPARVRRWDSSGAVGDEEVRLGLGHDRLDDVARAGRRPPP